MKKIKITGLSFLFTIILAFFICSIVSADTSGRTEKDQIHKDVALILNAEKEIQTNKGKIIALRQKLDADILAPAKHGNMKDTIRGYRSEDRVYRDEALDAINDLHAHWTSLTEDQRELVDQSPDDL